LSKRFGAISSASILFETSNAKTTSTPALEIVSIFVPILGFTNANARLAIASDSMITLIQDLKKDRFGLSNLSAFECANFF
jgi:hypothetical protein